MAYTRIKLFWGAVDTVQSDESPYTPAQTFGMGANATPPGIGVRRVQVVFTRAGIGSGEDDIVTSMDFQNFTNGQPDDTWTDADFTPIENALDNWWGAIKIFAFNKIVCAQYRWYRIGPGVAPPNPAARIIARSVPGTATSSSPSQVAMTVTERTAVRKAWGRMYLPLNIPTMYSSDGRIASANVDAVANATKTLYDAATANQTYPVVYSPTRGKAFSVETIQVDDLADVIRSRRFDKATYKKVLP